MSSHLLTTVLLLLVLGSQAQLSKCPAQDALSVATGSLTIAQTGNIGLQSGVDIQCYNYTLATPFDCSPGVAIAVNSLQSQYSPSLFFSIKAVKSDSNSVIPFVVRTHWGYTQWTRISFSFLAETSKQIEAGYYQIDTATLSACFSGKEVVAFIPFNNQNNVYSKALTFLNGFQITSVVSNSGSRTPYEVEVVVNSVTSQGITVMLQSTSATQVHAIFVSYLAYAQNIQNMVAGTYLYNQYNPVTALQFAPSIGVSSNQLAFHGLNSFIQRNSQSPFELSASFSSGRIFFSSSSSLYYLSYSYFFLIGGPCGVCSGYPINFDGTCVATCPPSSYYNGITCITCMPGQTWNGNQCVSRCTAPRIWDINSQSCVCPSGANWNGNTCITCSNGQIWFSSNNSCACPAGANWNGFICLTCRSGQVWSPSSYSCVCPSNSYWNHLACVSCNSQQIWDSINLRCVCPQGSNWNGTTCVTCNNGFVWNSQLNGCGCSPGYIVFRGSCALVPTCRNGQTLDTNSNICVCAQGANWNGQTCVFCTNGQIWNGQACVCPQNTFWNDYSCVSCSSGQIWNYNTKSCSCPNGQNWNGFSCISCSGGRTWSTSLNNCICPNSMNWNGNNCIACSSGQNWNGFSCITCTNGQIWNAGTSACQCPSGQQWNGNACLTPCPTGMVNINGLCSCPAGTYLSNGRCAIQPNCPSGQTWNGLQCTPIQCPSGTSWNGTLCTSTPTITCPLGTFYDGSRCITNTTTCPAGTSWDGNSCKTTGTCPFTYYQSSNGCVPISQICPAGLQWKLNQCVLIDNNCPSGSYYNGGQCTPFQPCTSGRVWNATFSQCVCPKGTFWNGNVCNQCSNGQSYQINSGCFCPKGTFLNQGSCAPVQVNQCASIANSIWNGNACVCNTGYEVIGMECVCQGLAVNASLCDRCHTKPNSNFVNGICQCKSGYADIDGKCVIPTTPPSNSPSCNVATYFDSQQKRCLPCSSGCLSCTTCYECTSCQPGFYMDFFSSLCSETCGDGKRFTLPCDDGNNINGDGCSNDCQVQVGYTCTGGSPNSRDSCTKTLPQALIFRSTGQSHLYGKIILNVHLNYLPLALVQSATDCVNKCNNVLSARIASGDRGSTGIVASYITTTSFSFSIEVNFGRQPIGLFSLEVGINPNLVQKYFSGINTSQKLLIDVNPAFLSLRTYNQEDQIDILS